MRDFDELLRVFEDDLFKKYNSPVTLREDLDSPEGIMMPQVHSVETGTWYIENPDKDERIQRFRSVLKDKKCADAIFWTLNQSNEWTLHIIEMKHSISASSRGVMKKQFLNAYRISLMLGGLFGIVFKEAVFYAVYVNDQFSSSSSTELTTEKLEDFSTMRNGLDISDDELSSREEWRRNVCILRDCDWRNDSKFRRHRHVKVQLTEEMVGQSLDSTGQVMLAAR